MVPSKQVDVVGTSGTDHKTVSGRRQSARGTGAAVRVVAPKQPVVGSLSSRARPS